MPSEATVLNFIQSGRSSKVICVKTEDAPSIKTGKMRLSKSKLRRRAEAKIDALQIDLAKMDAKKNGLPPQQYAALWSKQKDLIDDI
ncbi:MAG: hypothetical protein ABFD04_00370 [Syntrophomonas sp.]